MGHNTTLMGRIQKDTAVFLGETGPDGTTAFRGGTLKFYGASAVNENKVMTVKGGPTKRYFECTRGVGIGQAGQALSAPPPPPHHCSEMAHTVQYTNSSQQQQHSDIAQITLPNKLRMQYKNHAVHQVLSLQPNEASIDVLLSTESKKKPLCQQANISWRKKSHRLAWPLGKVGQI